ncbi:hypothetical protein [Prosthecobacter sp.]
MVTLPPLTCSGPVKRFAALRFRVPAVWVMPEPPETAPAMMMLAPFAVVVSVLFSTTGLLKDKLPAPPAVCQICGDPTVMFTPKICALAELFVMLPLFVMPAALLIVKAPPPASKVIPLVTAVAPLMFVRF